MSVFERALIGFVAVGVGALFVAATLYPIDSATLMTLTGWFISLYMGGHTVKEIGRQAVEAVKTWRGPHVQ